MANYKIKKCPKCGGAADLQIKQAENTSGYIVFGKCSSCGAEGKKFSSIPEHNTSGYGTPCINAATAWNNQKTNL